MEIFDSRNYKPCGLYYYLLTVRQDSHEIGTLVIQSLFHRENLEDSSQDILVAQNIYTEGKTMSKPIITVWNQKIFEKAQMGNIVPWEYSTEERDKTISKNEEHCLGCLWHSSSKNGFYVTQCMKYNITLRISTAPILVSSRCEECKRANR